MNLWKLNPEVAFDGGYKPSINKYLNVTVPPEMIHIATCSLVGAQPLFKSGCHIIIDVGILTKSVSPIFSTSEKCTCYTHKKKCINIINVCFKQEPFNMGYMMKTFINLAICQKCNDTLWIKRLSIVIISKPVDRFR